MGYRAIQCSARTLTLKMTNAPFYLPVGPELDIARHAHACQLPLLLKGPTGSGKSRFVEHLAFSLDQKLITVSCHEETSAVDLLGRHLIIGQETKWIDGPLTRAVREGAIIYLDELAEARPDTLVLLHSLTDHRRRLFVDRTNEEIVAPGQFMLLASFNPGYQNSLKELKPSTRQRFLTLNFSYPPNDLERQIVCKEAGVDTSTAGKLVKMASKVRGTHEMGLAETVSTRLLVDAGKLIQRGVDPRLACEVALVHVLTDEKVTTDALNDLVSLYF